MRIGPCIYNENDELMAPRPVDLNTTHMAGGGIPTTAVGFYHRHRIEGGTPRELDYRRRQFIEAIKNIPRLTIISERHYELDGMIRRGRGIEVIYAIEAPNGPEIQRRNPFHLMNRYSDNIEG